MTRLALAAEALNATVSAINDEVIQLKRGRVIRVCIDTVS
jgi:hypothetical protein